MNGSPVADVKIPARRLLAALLMLAAAAACAGGAEEEAPERSPAPPPAEGAGPELSPGLAPVEEDTASAAVPAPGARPPQGTIPESGENEDQLRDSVRLAPLIELPTVQDTAR